MDRGKLSAWLFLKKFLFTTKRRMEEVEGEIKSFLTWALDGDEW
jgi:hypothetical protein